MKDQRVSCPFQYLSILSVVLFVIPVVYLWKSIGKNEMWLFSFDLHIHATLRHRRYCFAVGSSSRGSMLIWSKFIHSPMRQRNADEDSWPETNIKPLYVSAFPHPEDSQTRSTMSCCLSVFPLKSPNDRIYMLYEYKGIGTKLHDHSRTIRTSV